MIWSPATSCSRVLCRRSQWITQCALRAYATGTSGSGDLAAARSSPQTSEPAAEEDSTCQRVGDRVPREIVAILDEYIVGQTKAKKAMAVTLRNRWRRNRVQDADLKAAIIPKNILMVGPTGVGKTEISRRMAKITDAPFVKVEATKYTEVGFAGKDVETIIEDLYSASKLVARRQLEKLRTKEARASVEALLIEKISDVSGITEVEAKAMLEKGEAENVEITYEVTDDKASTEFGSARRNEQPFPDNRELGAAFRSLFQGLRDASEGASPSKKSVTRPVHGARDDLLKEELSKLIPTAAVNQRAATLCQEHGIVFIDEIDKVVVGGRRKGSSNTNEEGVQYDLLPVIEGTTYTAKDGTILKTENILFIASGAFHTVKPSDMVAELQGRLPIRVELENLTMNDFQQILTVPRYNLLRQMQYLMKAEQVDLHFEPDAVWEIAQVSKRMNDYAQNIGARRLHTVLEQVMEKYCFDVETYQGTTVVVTKNDVKDALQHVEQKMDLAKYLI